MTSDDFAIGSYIRFIQPTSGTHGVAIAWLHRQVGTVLNPALGGGSIPGYILVHIKDERIWVHASTAEPISDEEFFFEKLKQDKFND